MVKARLERNLARVLVHLASERDRLKELQRDQNATAVERCRQQIRLKQENIATIREQLDALKGEQL